MCNVHVHTVYIYNVHLNYGSLKITIYLLIHSFIHLFSIVLKFFSVQFRCIYITTIHRNDRCISRESIRVVLFSIEVVAVFWQKHVNSME